MQPKKSEVHSLNINGLNGRELRLPASTDQGTTRSLVLVYGLHTSLERMYLVAKKLTEFGNVYMPDLPGFGGMTSFYTIHKKPTIDEYADYLATYVRLKFKGKPVDLVGFSFGMCVVTRMLQKYPELRPTCNNVWSFVGIIHHGGFGFTKRRMFMYKTLSALVSTKIGSVWFRCFCLNGSVLRLVYARTKNAKHKFKDMSAQDKKERLDFEINLWHCNEVRTWASLLNQMFYMDLTEPPTGKRVIHMQVDDQYFNNKIVSHHLAVAYHPVTLVMSEATQHMPTYFASMEEIDRFVPKEMYTHFSKDSK
jgi:pimeloyl-ACP methyl ester carboxylesterase